MVRVVVVVVVVLVVVLWRGRNFGLSGGPLIGIGRVSGICLYPAVRHVDYGLYVL